MDCLLEQQKIYTLQEVMIQSKTWAIKRLIYYVTYYSSRGPTFDGRIKPDVVAVGELYSAKSSGTSENYTCEVLFMQGTYLFTYK